MKLSKKYIILVFFVFRIGIAGEGNASALWFNFIDPSEKKGDLVMIDFEIDSSAKSTYYAAINFSGGYCGVQDHGTQRTLHFSLWHHKEGEGSIANLAWKGYRVDHLMNFPEGRGGVKTTKNYYWENDTRYRLAIKYRFGELDSVDGAFRDFWFLDFEKGEWFHMASLFRSHLNNLEKEYPKDIGSFIEDFGRSKERHRAYYLFNARKKYYGSTEWFEYSSARYNKMKPEYEQANGIVKDNKFYLATGGDSIPENPTTSGSVLTVNPTSIEPENPVLENITIESVNDTTILVKWGYEKKLWAAQEWFDIRIYSDQQMNIKVYNTGRLYPHDYEFMQWEENTDRKYKIEGLGLENGKTYYLRLLTGTIFGYNCWNTTPVEFNNTTSIDGIGSRMPEKVKIEKIYPNPFNPITKIRYYIPEESHVSIKIFDILGHEISTLYNGNQNSGQRSVIWNGKNNTGQKVQSGMYFCSVLSENTQVIKKLMLMK